MDLVFCPGDEDIFKKPSIQGIFRDQSEHTEEEIANQSTSKYILKVQVCIDFCDVRALVIVFLGLFKNCTSETSISQVTLMGHFVCMSSP